MLTKDQVYLFLFGWLKAESGLTVIKANQHDPRPPRPYVSLNFQDPSSKLGIAIDQQSTTIPVVVDVSHPVTVSTEGMRKAIASINIFGENAVSLLAKARDSLDRPDVAESFERAGIVHLDDGPITDLTELQETIYEERGQMDLTVAFVSSSEVDVGTIENVETTGEVADQTVATNVET